MHRHVKQRHSKNPLRFPCTICGKVFARAENSKFHMETIHADQKMCYRCGYCNATFTRKSSRQHHQRRVHGHVCREHHVNLQLHLQHLSEETNFQDEWMFVESRPIQPGKHNACPCGQTAIESYFFLENKLNGNRTFVGSDCIRNIDAKATAVISYFNHIIENEVLGVYKGQDEKGLQRFEVKSNTILVCNLKDVEHLNPQVTRNLDVQWEVSVKYPNVETLVEDQVYSLSLKAKYQRGQLTFTAL